jgi:hypothetical protein
MALIDRASAAVRATNSSLASASLQRLARCRSPPRTNPGSLSPVYAKRTTISPTLDKLLAGAHLTLSFDNRSLFPIHRLRLSPWFVLLLRWDEACAAAKVLLCVGVEVILKSLCSFKKNKNNGESLMHNRGGVKMMLTPTPKPEIHRVDP